MKSVQSNNFLVNNLLDIILHIKILVRMQVRFFITDFTGNALFLYVFCLKTDIFEALPMTWSFPFSLWTTSSCSGQSGCFFSPCKYVVSDPILHQAVLKVVVYLLFASCTFYKEWMHQWYILHGVKRKFSVSLLARLMNW